MSGWLRIIGLGPGPAEWLTPEASHWLHTATDAVGYTPYIAALPATIAATRHASDNGVELDRARDALRMAERGARVAVVSGGDAGVFGMAAAVCEAIDMGDATWRALDVAVIPGMTALLAASARVGAPLGHDFCVLSLSDRLKPWNIIEMRLRAACAGDFALAIYNPASHSRKEQLARALTLLTELRGSDTVAIAAQAVGRADERLHVATLGTLDATIVDMRTLLLIGSSRTQRIERPGLPPLIYTPRYYEITP